jgi:hypothetical protein
VHPMDQISRDGTYGVPETEKKIKGIISLIKVENNYTQLTSGGR